MGCFLFDERIGCFNDPPPLQARQFIDSISGFFKHQQPLMYGLPVYKVFPTASWRKFERSTDRLIQHAQKFVIKVSIQPFDTHCCYTGTVIKHPVSVPVRVKQPFVIFDIQAL